MANRRRPLRRSVTRVGALTLVTALCALATATTASAATPASSFAPGQRLTAGATYYAVGVPVCKQPTKPRLAACTAMVRELVRRGTPGARPFEPAGGASSPAAIGPAGGLTPADLASAYGLTTTGGSGQTVAVVDAFNDPDINADLTSFSSNYGLPACDEADGCLTVVGQTGKKTALPANDEIGWSVEESLDVESVHSVCPSCKILVVEADSQSVADLAAASNEAVTLHATEVSNSWGGPEIDSSNAIKADFNHPGVVITASAGDHGWMNYDKLTPSDNTSQIPAEYNTVVAVGGTTLDLGPTGARQSEAVWNDNGPRDDVQQLAGEALGATGGGCSATQPAAAWQLAQPGWSLTGCGSHRLDNDIAAVGDPVTGLDVYDTYRCNEGCVSSAGWETIGGTSLAAPVVASMYALAGGSGGVPYPALTLYGHPKSTYDVTVGGNGWCDGEGAAQCADPNLSGVGDVDCAYSSGGLASAVDGACDALSGYDGPSGLGTPVGLTAFHPTGPTGQATGPATVTHGTTASFTVKPTDPFPGGRVTAYTFKWGDGSANTASTTGTANHVFAAAGADTLTVALVDNYDVDGTVTYKVTVK